MKWLYGRSEARFRLHKRGEGGGREKGSVYEYMLGVRGFLFADVFELSDSHGDEKKEEEEEKKEKQKEQEEDEEE